MLRTRFRSSMVLVLVAIPILVLVACGGGSTDGSPESGRSEAVSEVSAGSTPSLLATADPSLGPTFTHSAGAAGEQLFPEMMGGGVAVFDADGDGALDLYFASGAQDLGRGAGGTVNRFYRQTQEGRFVDETEASGLGDPGYGTGLAVGDVDNDGDEDLFVANFGPDRLYLGDGRGRFEDATEAAGIAATGESWDDWSTSAAFCDVDRDGFLDLYVVRYVVFDESIRCTDKAGRPDYCGPDSFEDRTDVLLRNRGDGMFVDITAEAGIDVATGAGLGVVCEDFDDDGWVDIYVANDGDANQLWTNQGVGPGGVVSFLDEALIMGTSVNAAGLQEAGMGVIAADFDNDADFDLFLTHLRDETNTFYRNLGPGLGFQDDSARAGLAATSTPFTGFGTAAVDLDLDGDLDLVVANGRVKRGEILAPDLPDPWGLYAEPNLVYANDGGAFRDAGSEVAAFTGPIEIGRGLATGDLDGDGDLDLVLNNLEGEARVYHGQPASGHWLIVDAVDPRLGRRALGARLTLRGDGDPQVRTVQGAMSYLSSSDPRAHFGLGDDGGPVDVEVRWPDGRIETFPAIAVDRAVILQRGEGEE